MNIGGSMGPTSELGLSVIRAHPGYLPARELDKFSKPQRGLQEEVNDWRSDNRKHLKGQIKDLGKAEKLGVTNLYGRLWLRKVEEDGQIVDFGLASLRVVTDVAVNAIVAAMNTLTASSTIFTVWKYHGLGTGTTAEASSDTALVTETTAYAAGQGSVRATGTQTTPSGNVTNTNIYRTVATNTVNTSVAATEHGIFSANASGTLLDRSVFSVINLANGDGIQSTYDLTFTSGG